MSTGYMPNIMDLNNLNTLYQNQKMMQGRLPSSYTSRPMGSSLHVNTFPRARGFSTSVVPNQTGFSSPTSSGGSISSLSECPQHLFNQISNRHPVREIKKIDRSFSLNDMDLNLNNQQQVRNSVNTSRYKTELCRPFEESGFCKYGDKCQFAHGMPELKNLSRHPKYKTDLCRTYHTVGFCPYGPRCHFVHCEEERRLCMALQALVKNPPPTGMQSVPFNLPLSLGSTGESPESSISGSPSLSPSFHNFMDEVNKSIYSQNYINNNNNDHIYDDVFTPSSTPNSSVPSSPQHDSHNLDYDRSCGSPVSVSMDLSKQFALLDLRLPIFSMPFDD